MATEKIKKNAISLNPEGIPEEMKARPQWIVWKLTPNKDGNLQRVPFQVKMGGRLVHASSTKPETWSTFKDALKCFNHRPDVDGISFALSPSDSYIGIDVDQCVNDKGMTSTKMNEILAGLDSYTELSPGGDGLRIFIQVNKEFKCKRKKFPEYSIGELEVYFKSKFLTITGHHYNVKTKDGQFPRDPNQIQQRTPVLAKLYEELRLNERKKPVRKSKQPIDITDAELLDKMFASKNGNKIQALWSGNMSAYDDDHSSADLALCGHLASRTGGDFQRIDSLFQQSGLMREKWNRPDYKRSTIEKAISNCNIFYKPAGSGNNNQPPRHHSGGGTIDPGFIDLSQNGIANTFIEKHGHEILYERQQDIWYKWNGKRWENTTEVDIKYLVRVLITEDLFDRIQKVGDEEKQASLLKTWRRSATDRMYTSIVRVATTFREIWINADQFDADPWVLNVENGIMDLTTGTLRPHESHALLTKIAPVKWEGADARSEEWDDFITVVCGGHIKEVKDETIAKLRQYLQRLAGYMLIGCNPEEKFMLIYGPTRSGKSTFLSAMRAILGASLGNGNCGYCLDTESESFLQSFGNNPGGPRADLVAMQGARLVITSELPPNRRIDAEKLKRLSGGDWITARAPHSKSAVTFFMQALIIFAANNAPSLDASDSALKRRFIPFPFPFSIPEGKEDPSLKASLSDVKKTGSAILAWAVEGLQIYLEKHSLGELPAEILESREDIYDSQNPLMDFIEEQCILDPKESIPTKLLRDKFNEYRKDQRPMSTHAFARYLLNSYDGAITEKRIQVDGRRERHFVGIVPRGSQSELKATF